MNRILLTLSLLLAAATGSANQELKTYSSKPFGYSFTYPATWWIKKDPATDDTHSFSVYSPGSDANMNVKVSRLPPEMRKYRSILQVPNLKVEMQQYVRDQLSATKVSTGSTTLSNGEAFWLRHNSVHRSLGKEGWFHMYQLMSIKDDRLYTITVSALGRSEKEAENRFGMYWPLFEECLMGFFFVGR